MRIGVDFDNTIVRYDELFHRIACERGLIPPATPVSKTSVRDALRAKGLEREWIDLQGLVYGRRILEAPPFPGVMAFFVEARRRGHRLCIISHKTRLPVNGDAVDLHAAATRWLETHGFFDGAQAGLSHQDVFFELTKQAKLQRIADCGCEHFVDDLPEFLAEPAFPPGVRKWLIHRETLPQDDSDIAPLVSWRDAMDRLLMERIPA